MLEKNENIFYFDAHFHLADCIYDGLIKDDFPKDIYACTCSHSKEEWELTEGFKMAFSYGLHPQSAGHIDVKTNADFLEELLQQKKLNAIGETGFDYFSEEFKEQAATQEEMFNIQLELALKYNKPLVIHCRKANEKLFEYSKQLKKVPAVLFHSFMGMPKEALSLIARGINAYFSFGKQVLNNNKKVIACVKELPDSVLLTETDAPWQFLKGEKFTHPADIKRVFEAFCQIKNQSPDQLQAAFKRNFLDLFSIKG